MAKTAENLCWGVSAVGGKGILQRSLAKFCNHLAKRYPDHFGGVVVWDNWNETIRLRAFRSQRVDEIWGIGRRTADKLSEQGIRTVLDFVEADTATHTPTVRRNSGANAKRDAGYCL